MKRMLQPPVVELHNRKDLSSFTKKDFASSWVLCADKVDADMEDLALEYQATHRFFLAVPLEACPVSQKERPVLVVYSPSHQQWSPKGKGLPAAKVAGPELINQGREAISAWLSRHRFPGVWR